MVLRVRTDYGVTSIVLAFGAGIFCHAAFYERRQSAAILAVALMGGFLAMAVRLVEVP
jgi:hypothetical protein